MAAVHAGDLIAGRYRLDATVGTGGMGTVWRATDLELRREVAAKQASAGDTGREARIGAGLQHPNVITVFDTVAGQDGERLLVMEYLPSRTLAQILREDGPLPPREAAHVGAQIADALTAMHVKGMVHRDITPNNILITEDRTAKLADLGIAMWANVTETGSAYTPGTPGYIAPEVVAGNATSSASDMYALGVTLSTAVEGAEETADLPADQPWFAIVVSALTHPNPRRRPTAARAREMLEVSSGAKTSTTRGRRRVLLAAGAILVAATVIATVVTWEPAVVGTQSIVGDPKTADPCELVGDLRLLARFGKVDVDKDFGEFNRCDVVVTGDKGDEARVWVRVETGVNDSNGTWPESLAGGPVRVVPIAHEPEHNWCKRMVLLPQRYRLAITAKAENDVPDECGMADALTSIALAALAGGQIPRRSTPFDAAALATVDACALLDPADVAGVLGPGYAGPNPGFANWECTWLGVDTRPHVEISFVYDWPLTDHYGTVIQVEGRTAVVNSQDWGDNTCLVTVQYKPFTSTDQGTEKPKVEQVRVLVNGGGQPDRCESAKTLATAAAKRLPA